MRERDHIVDELLCNLSLEYNLLSMALKSFSWTLAFFFFFNFLIL
jgi:hypothetical protein